MIRRSRMWLAIAIGFTLINVGGAVFAAFSAELGHTLVHLALIPLGGYFVWLALRGRQQAPPSAQRTDRLDYLQQSVDAIALEIERIGEAQRFNDKLVAELNPKSSPPAER